MARLLELEGDLQAAQMRTKEFQGVFEDFMRTLHDMEEMAAKLEPVSAVWGKVKEQKKQGEVRISYDSQRHPLGRFYDARSNRGVMRHH